jgi:hypothetical protein
LPLRIIFLQALPETEAMVLAVVVAVVAVVAISVLAALVAVVAVEHPMEAVVVPVEAVG